MSGLIKKPRVRWLAGQWVIMDNQHCFNGDCLIEVIRECFDWKYGKGNHGYR